MQPTGQSTRLALLKLVLIHLHLCPLAPESTFSMYQIYFYIADNLPNMTLRRCGCAQSVISRCRPRVYISHHSACDLLNLLVNGPGSFFDLSPRVTPISYGSVILFQCPQPHGLHKVSGSPDLTFHNHIPLTVATDTSASHVCAMMGTMCKGTSIQSGSVVEP